MVQTVRVRDARLSSACSSIVVLFSSIVVLFALLILASCNSNDPGPDLDAERCYRGFLILMRALLPRLLILMRALLPRLPDLDAGAITAVPDLDAGAITAASELPEFTVITASRGYSDYFEGHSCGIRVDKTVACWGYNDIRAGGCAARVSSPPSPPAFCIRAGSEPIKTVTCWGDNDAGQAVAPSGEFTAVTADGDSFVRDQSRPDRHLLGRAANYGQADAPSGEFTAITAGYGLIPAGSESTRPSLVGVTTMHGQAVAPSGVSSVPSPLVMGIRVGSESTRPSPAGATTPNTGRRISAAG